MYSPHLVIAVWFFVVFSISCGTVLVQHQHFFVLAALFLTTVSLCVTSSSCITFQCQLLSAQCNNVVKAELVGIQEKNRTLAISMLSIFTTLNIDNTTAIFSCSRGCQSWELRTMHDQYLKLHGSFSFSHPCLFTYGCIIAVASPCMQKKSCLDQCGTRHTHIANR